MNKNDLNFGDISLPLDIITMRVALYGDSGSGKTAFGRLVAERVHHANQRFCAIDLKNDWYGLKSSADGNSPGIPVVIFGGPRGDVKLIDDAAAAQTLADTVASIEQSVILDLDSMSRTKQEKFLVPFLDRLYDVNRSPLMLFCDEADRYAPQKPMTQEAILSLSSSEDIARRGRKRGLGSFWLTQRTAVLNKNVSEFSNLTVVFRTPGSKDLNELEERVGRIADKGTVKEVLRLAPGLADGQAFFLSSHPKLRPYMPDPVRPIQLPMPWTFDSSATPGVGQRKREPKVLAQTDLLAIQEKMASQVERAKADDPKTLRARIAELEKLAKAQQSKPSPVAKVDTKIVEIPVVRPSEVKRVEDIVTRLEKEGERRIQAAEALRQSGEELRQTGGSFAEALRRASAPQTNQLAVHRPMPSTIKRPVAPLTRARDAVTPATVGDLKISSTQQRILDALAWYESLGNRQPTLTQIGAVALIDPTGGHFSNVSGPLSTAGLVVRGTGVLELTEAGRAIAHQPESVGSLDEYHEVLRNRVRKMKSSGGKTIELLNAIIAAGGQTLSTEQLGESVGIDHSGGHFSNMIGPLGTAGLIERRAGTVMPTGILFPDGLL